MSNFSLRWRLCLVVEETFLSHWLRGSWITLGLTANRLHPDAAHSMHRSIAYQGPYSPAAVLSFLPVTPFLIVFSTSVSSHSLASCHSRWFRITWTEDSSIILLRLFITLQRPLSVIRHGSDAAFKILFEFCKMEFAWTAMRASWHPAT